MARTLSGSIAFTVPAVPTGMKAGVRISPRGVEITPVRALPSRACRVKEKPVAMISSCCQMAPFWREGTELPRGAGLSPSPG